VQISDLQRGDILLLEDTPANHTIKHGFIKIGQRLTGLNRKRANQGRSDLVHALISIGYGAVAEASGEGGAVRARELLRPTAGDIDDTVNTYVVYRCKLSQLARGAANAALFWSTSGGMKYAKRKAITSIAHSDTLGEHGEARAEKYADQLYRAIHSHAVSGPFAKGGAFCSEFVIACYQAAALEHDVNLNFGGDLLQCDAKHCSVRGLHDRLLRDGVFGMAGDGVLDLSLE
jgi:hypothetical protein